MIKKPSGQRPGGPQKKVGFLERFLKGNFLLIGVVVGLLVILVVVFSRPKKAAEEVQPDSPSMVQEKGAGKKPPPSRRTDNRVPRKSSSKAEKMNITEEPPTPEFVKQHVAKLTNVMDSQLHGAELTLQVETDPAKIEEIKRRMAAAKRMRDKLQQVNPDDPSTWFFMKKQKGSEEPADLTNDFFDKQGSPLMDEP